MFIYAFIEVLLQLVVDPIREILNDILVVVNDFIVVVYISSLLVLLLTVINAHNFDISGYVFVKFWVIDKYSDEGFAGIEDI